MRGEPANKLSRRMLGLVAIPLASALSYFQAIVLGVLQGVSELFPISSLGHTVLFPTLFGWNRLVDAQSQSESFWLAFVVMLHVGSALGLLAYYWRDWVQIVRAFFRTLAKRRIEDPTERLAWLIVTASIPAGIIGLALEHQLRTLTAKPEVAAIFLMVNGCVLFAAERFRRRAEVRELAEREGAKPDGARELDTLEYREALVVGVAQSTRAGRGHQPRRRDDGRGPRARAGPQRLGPLRVPARHADHPRGGRGQAARPAGPPRQRDPRPGAGRVRGRRRHGRLHGALPGPLLQDQDADAVRDLLPAVRRAMVIYTQT